jgi:hypothetical protein
MSTSAIVAFDLAKGKRFVIWVLRLSLETRKPIALSDGSRNHVTTSEQST